MHIGYTASPGVQVYGSEGKSKEEWAHLGRCSLSFGCIAQGIGLVVLLVVHVAFSSRPPSRLPALATARPRASWLACRLDVPTIRSLPPIHLITTRLPTRSLVLLFTHIPARSHDHLLSRRTAHHLPIRPCGSLSFASHLFINHALTWGIGLEVLAIVVGAVRIVCFSSVHMPTCLPTR